MRKILLLLFVFKVSISFAQKNEINSGDLILNQIAAANVYELSNTVGFSGRASHQLILLDSLVAVCSNDYLLKNAALHKNAVVRLYCYKALVLKNATIPSFLKKKFNEDSTEILFASGCLMEIKTVETFYKHNLLQTY